MARIAPHVGRASPVPKAQAYHPMPPISFLHECFAIDPTVPNGLRWKSRPRSHFRQASSFVQFNTYHAGEPAGYLCAKYFRMSIGFKEGDRWVQTALHNHRVIWAMTHMRDPGEFIVDHADLNKKNNDPLNLRLATQAQSSQNRNKRSDNRSGVTGISFRPEVNKWRVRITVLKKVIDVGYFPLKQDAIDARRQAELFYFGDFSPPEVTP